MKKFVFILAVLPMFFSAKSQETAPKYELGLNLGNVSYNNYSCVSLFPDATDRYLTFGADLRFGMLKGKNLYGLNLEMKTATTSNIAVNEEMMHMGLALTYRRYERLGERLEPFFGVQCGVALMDNNADVLDGGVQRWGTYGRMEIGLHYNISPRSFFGISGGISLGTMSSKVDLPAGVAGSNKSYFFSSNIMVGYGIRF